MIEEEPAPPSRKDRFIAKLADFIVRAIYRDVEVFWSSPPSARGPLLSVANHFGGISDALVLLYALPRRPGIIARDVIWRTPVVGRLMTWIGAIPVHKADDGRAASANDQMFASCYEALADDGHLLIFPEGVTRNDPSIAPVKTGAARIALGARAAGADQVAIQPIGIHYEDKAALRSRVVVIGELPLPVDEVVAARDAGGEVVTADDHGAVRALTDEIEVRLRRAAPDFADWDETRTLTEAAEVALRSQIDEPGRPVPVVLRDRLANVLADRGPERRRAIREAVATYREDLDGLGLTDADALERVTTGRLLLSLAGRLLVGLLLLPFAVVGAVINVVPFLIVKAVGAGRLSPSMAATVKPLVALVAFGAAWGLTIWAAFSTFGFTGVAEAIILLPIYLGAAILLVERIGPAWRLVRRWRVGGRVPRFDARLAADRDAVVEAVLAL